MFQKWKTDRLRIFEKDFFELQVEEERNAQLKATEEVQMVKEKMSFEIEAKKRIKLNENEAKLGVSHSCSRKYSYINDFVLTSLCCTN